MKQQLEKIWSKEYLNSLPSIIKERGFCYSVNQSQKDILITGINPSYRNDAVNGNCNFDFQLIVNDNRYDRYWTSLKKIVYDKDADIDLTSKTAYLDIFYFRETDQKFLKKQILSKTEGISFVIDQIKLTQSIIEDIIKPKLVIVKNKESAAYWGKLAHEGIIWMGYELKLLKTLDAGELYEITGLIDSEQRLSYDVKTTNLTGSLILFTQHFQYAPVEKRPNAKLISEFLKPDTSDIYY